ncbi:paraquat-inducible protein A [Puia sp. P3]|uniref:paraquat-inducible protein A n=1 Tax=Puia sp. P3 TaxID=3423952 RepID=UPI003D672BC7
MNRLSFKVLLLIAGTLVLVAGVGICAFRLHDLSVRQKVVKEDYSFVNNISFGVLSVNKWRDLMVTAISHRIENFNLSAAERDSLEKAVEGILNGLVDKVDSLMDAPQKSLGGKLRKLAYHAFVKKDDMHKMVPSFSRKIMAELMRPRNKDKLAYLAKSKLEDLGQDTYDSSQLAETSRLDSVYRKYGVKDVDGFDKYVAGHLADIQRNSYRYAYAMLGLVFIVLIIWIPLRRSQTLFVPLYLLSILMALVLLVTGITSTMIEIDARINSLSFTVIGETVAFKNQVIFFQSKSIVDVVRILIQTGRTDSILVGILILMFSIFFPVTKLLSAGIYLLSGKWSKNRLINYFAFHSGKWSMADVTVVAIFMAYIGFNGILDDQMRYLNFNSSGFTSIATNHTSLQPGYIVFVGFVLFGLLLSQLLQHRKKMPVHY